MSETESRPSPGDLAPEAMARQDLIARVRRLEARVRELEGGGGGAVGGEPALGDAGDGEFHVMADIAPVMLWITDTENRCTFLSRGWSEYTGQARDEGLGFGWLQAVHPDEREEAGRRFVEAATHRRPFSLDHRLRRRDGRYRSVVDEGRPRFDADGEWQGYIGAVVDVHDRWVAAQALHRSEARYRALFEAIDEGFCVIQLIFGEDDRPLDYRFLEANPAMRKHTGLDDVIGRTAREVLPELEEHWFRIYGEVALTGTPRRFESGSGVMSRWFDVFAFRTGDPAERKVALLFTDISEQRIADEALRRSAEQLQGLADAALSIHSARDIDDMLGIITEQARRLIGAHQAVTSLTTGADWAQAVNAVSLSDKYAAWRGYDRTPDGSGIYRLVARTGRSMRLTQAELEAHPAWHGFGAAAAEHPPMRGWLAAPLTRRDGANLGLIQLSDKVDGEFTAADEAILIQLAHLAAVGIENARLLRDVQQANQVKSDFLASMSHELRTPLNAIGGYVDLIELGVHGPLTDEQRHALARIGTNQRHLLTLINDILSFARLEAGRIELDVDALPAADLLASIEPLVAPQAAARRITYRVEPCDPALVLRGDAERVRQILLNLVGNAIKFTAPGGWIAVSCEAQGRWADLRVTDNGTGIREEEQQRIFDPFQQVGRRLNQPKEGLGLGLAISRDLARAMSGDLTVRSAPGEGSTFTLRLPRPGGP